MPGQAPPALARRNSVAQHDPDPTLLAAALRHGAEPRHGLTLVLGCPLPTETLQYLDLLRTALEPILRGRVRWLAPAACHLTVYGLRRSQALPLDGAEIGALLAPVRGALRSALAGVARIRVALEGPAIGPDGALYLAAGACPTLDALRSALARLPGVDAPKAVANHITLGQLTCPFGSERHFRQAVASLGALGCGPAPDLAVEVLRLVHYRSRWLEELAWQETIVL